MLRRSLLFVLAGVLSNAASVASAESIRLEPHRKQLFLDDHAAESIQGLRRVMHRPKKYGPVLRPDGKADGIRLQAGSAPVWDPEKGVYKLFYMAFPYGKGEGQWILNEIGPAVAISKDGLHWERPSLGIVDWQGSKQNNRFFVVDPKLRWGHNRFIEVLCTPHDPDPQRRYKGLLGAIGRTPVVSPDGIHWKTIGAKTIPSSDTSTLIYDELGKRYLAILKNGTEFGRSAAVAFSTDFKTWTTPRTTFHTDEQDQVMAKRRIAARLADPDMQNPMFNFREPDEPWSPGKDAKPAGPIDGEDFNQTGSGKDFRIPTWRAETYKMGVFPYEGVYMGVVMLYYPTGPAIPAWNNTVGFNEFQLVFSRDSQLRKENWHRLGNREPFLETSPLNKGLVGNFDRQQMGVFNRPLVMGDELWFYYNGAKGRTPPYKMWPDGTVRNQANLTPEENADFDDGWITVCLAKLRLDGFVSLTAVDNAGQVTTKPFVATGERLLLNVDVSDDGEATVEVLDENKQTIRGFELSSSVPLRGRSIEQTVRWTTKANWSELAGKKVRLRIRLRNADLYAFWTAKE